MRKMGDRGQYFTTVPSSEEGADHLVEVFRDGELLVEQSFEEIRARAGASYTI